MAANAIVGFKALGDALGVSKKTAWEYAAHPDWPFGSGPWARSILAQIRQWQASLPGRSAGGGTVRTAVKQRDLTEARIDKTLADTQARRLETAIKAKQFHNAQDCLRRRLSALHRHKENLYDMIDGLPVDNATRQIVRDATDRLLEDLSGSYGTDPQTERPPV